MQFANILIDPTAIADVKQSLAMGYADTLYCCKTLFPDRFYRPFDEIHRDMIEPYDLGTSQIVVIAAPRGIGKTSLYNFGVSAKAALYGTAKYIVNVSATTTLAMQQSENMKWELTSNPIIHKLFGDIKTDQFSKEQWVIRAAGHESCIMPRGAETQIRGMLWRHYRPDLIIVDDLETPEGVMSEDRRAKLEEWFYADLMGAVDRSSKDWRIIFIGTVLHESSLLMKLLESTNWDGRILELCDDDYKSNAPNTMTDEEVKQLAKRYEDDGNLDTFFREFRNKPISTQDAAFRQSYFKHYSENEKPLNLDPHVETIVIVDPAKTAKMESAHSAIVGVGINARGQLFYVRDIDAGRFYPDEIIDRTISMAQRLNARIIGVEATGIEEWILYPFRTELARRGLHYELMELKAKQGRKLEGKDARGNASKGKILRVRGLIPFYRRGQIIHNEVCCSGLEAQLLSYPRPSRWDIMDALGYFPYIMDEGMRYLMPNEDYSDIEDDDFMMVEDADFYMEPLVNFGII